MVLFGQLGHRLHIRNGQQWIGWRLDINHLGVRLNFGLEIRSLPTFGKGKLDAVFRKFLVHQIVGAAIKRLL